MFNYRNVMYIMYINVHCSGNDKALRNSAKEYKRGMSMYDRGKRGDTLFDWG